MKNQIAPLQQQAHSEAKAQKAIDQINQLIQERYPSLSALAKNMLIAECLIEIAEENKLQRQKVA